MTKDKKRIVGFLILNPNSKLPAICLGVKLRAYQCGQLLDELVVSGVVCGRGYAAHTEEYYVPDGEKVLDLERLGGQAARRSA